MNMSNAAILLLIERWRNAWLDLDVEAMVGLFAQEDNEIIYLAEENEDAARGTQGVRAYWEHTKRNVLAAVLRWEILDAPSITFLSDGIALAWFRVDTILALVGLDPAVAGILRVSLGLVENGDEWRIVHYHESRHLFPKAGQGDDHAFTTDIRLIGRETII